MSDANTLAPTDAENFLAQIDELVAQAREDDRLCYDQIPSQRYADARERIVSAVLAKWGTPAPASHPVAVPAQAGEQKRLPLAITSAPERIWLALGFNPYEEDAHFSNLHDLTWSQDNATGDGIKYVRADLAARGAVQAAPAPHYGNGRYLGFARYNDAYSVAQVQAMLSSAPNEMSEYPPLVCDYCGALTPDPWHSSGMMNGKMSKHIHSCDACAARGITQAAPIGIRPTARIRYERNTPGRENEMPRVVSCNRLADGIYEVFTASQVQTMLAAKTQPTTE